MKRKLWNFSRRRYANKLEKCLLRMLQDYSASSLLFNINNSNWSCDIMRIAFAYFVGKILLENSIVVFFHILVTELTFCLVCWAKGWFSVGYYVNFLQFLKVSKFFVQFFASFVQIFFGFIETFSIFPFFAVLCKFFQYFPN